MIFQGEAITEVGNGRERENGRGSHGFGGVFSDYCRQLGWLRSLLDEGSPVAGDGEVSMVSVGVRLGSCLRLVEERGVQGMKGELFVHLCVGLQWSPRMQRGVLR